MIIRRLESGDMEEWLRMRLALWPEFTADEHRAEMANILSDETQPVFVAPRPKDGLGGFLEASLHPFANGCETHPVGYIEGWYVDPDLRQQGIGGQLMDAAEAWARQLGCQEMASDCLIDNRVSWHAHLAQGYEEVERLIHFRKRLK